MKQGTEMKINRLPVRTWNWLHMNESSLSDIDTVLLSRDKPADGPVLTLPKEGISCIRGMSTGWWRPVSGILPRAWGRIWRS